jgi:hypothetical protein
LPRSSCPPLSCPLAPPGLLLLHLWGLPPPPRLGLLDLESLLLLGLLDSLLLLGLLESLLLGGDLQRGGERERGLLLSPLSPAPESLREGELPLRGLLLLSTPPAPRPAGEREREEREEREEELDRDDEEEPDLAILQQELAR